MFEDHTRKTARHRIYRRENIFTETGRDYSIYYKKELQGFFTNIHNSLFSVI